MWNKVWNDVIIPVLEASFDWINQFFTAIPEFKNLVISLFVILCISRFILFPLLGISNSVFRQEIKAAAREPSKSKSESDNKKSETSGSKKKTVSVSSYGTKE